MKKICSILTLLVLLTVVPAKAQPGEDVFNFGVKAGLNFTNMSGFSDFYEDGLLQTHTVFNVGAVFNFNLPLGFELNPEIIYVQSGTRSDLGNLMGESLSSTYRSGSIRVPINLQWGIRFLKIIKPYVVVSPYVGAVVFGNGNILEADLSNETVREYLNRFQYGIGIGAGLYVWRFQVSFKWNWDLNPVFKDDFLSVGMDDDSKFNGGELSLAFFF